jgi:cobalt-zinc-cadmium resistance protein CzcA
VPGVADDSGVGGLTMQYHLLLDPARVAGPGLSIPGIVSSLSANNGNAGGGFYSQGGQFYYVRGLGRLKTPEDIGNVVLAVHNGIPVLAKDVGRVAIGTAPRLGQFGFNDHDDAIEGVILMRKGEQAQVVLKRVQEKVRELNEHILPKDVKINTFYDRSDLVALTTRTVENNLLHGMLLVVVILVFFLYDLRSGVIVAVTIPLALFFAFVCLDLKHVPANLLSIGAIDFGILVDGAVVMVENIFRQVALRHGKPFEVGEVIVEAAAEVDRPIFYAVAVIVAGFLPIYALSGPSGQLFAPMADTTIFALLGSLVVTMTLLPVLCSWAMKRGVRERRQPEQLLVGPQERVVVEPVGGLRTGDQHAGQYPRHRIAWLPYHGADQSAFDPCDERSFSLRRQQGDRAGAFRKGCVRPASLSGDAVARRLSPSCRSCGRCQGALGRRHRCGAPPEGQGKREPGAATSRLVRAR